MHNGPGDGQATAVYGTLPDGGDRRPCEGKAGDMGDGPRPRPRTASPHLPGDAGEYGITAII